MSHSGELCVKAVKDEEGGREGEREKRKTEKEREPVVAEAAALVPPEPRLEQPAITFLSQWLPVSHL